MTDRMDPGAHSRWLRRRLHAIRRDWHDGGPTQIVMRLLQRIGLQIVHDVVIFQLDRNAFNSTFDPPFDLEFSLARDTDIEEIAACSSADDRSRARQVALFRKFLLAGNTCIVVRRHGRVIAHQWAFFGNYIVTIDNYRATAVPVRLDPASVFMGNAFVVPEHRGQGIIRDLKRYYFRTVPADWSIYTWIDRLNDSSIRANVATGFRRIAVLRFIGPARYARVALLDLSTGAWQGFGRYVPGLRTAGGRILRDP